MVEHGLDPVRLARIVAALNPGEGDLNPSLCRASATVMQVTGAGVVLILRGRTLATVCASDARAGIVEDVQYTLGEGPCVDAFHSKAPVLIPDLAAPDGRWPGFRTGAMAEGIRAVFGFPLLVGTVCIGALNLYHDQIGDLTEDQLADAVVVAHVAGRTVMGWQSVAGPGSLARQLENTDTHRAVVNQAAGMISVQAGVSVDDALLLLRAYAFAEDCPVSDAAAAVVDRGLRFD